MTSRYLGLGVPPPLVAVLLLGSGCVTEALWGIEPAARLVVVSQHRVDATIDVMADFEASGDLLFDHAPPISHVDLLDECARRLRALDSRLWLPRDRDRPGRLAGCAWLDADGGLLTDDVRANLLRDLAMDDPPGGHLEVLAGLQLLAVVAGSEGREFFALPPDRVWIWSTLDVEGLAALGEGTMRLDYLGGRIERDEGRTAAIKVLLTPATIAIDSLLYILESWVVYSGKHRDWPGRARRSR